MDESPRKISDFHLTESLHSGSKCEVHSGRFAQAGGVVQNAAVKVLKPRFAFMGDELRSFLAEVGWATDLRFSIFPRVFEAGEHRGNYFLAMEQVDGWTLSEVLGSLVTLKVPLPCEVGISIAHQLAAGMHQVHEHIEDGQHLGVVHLGINPDNIMLSKVGQVKLLDFGMTVATADEGMIQSDDRATDYQSPERLRALPVDRRADVYSLGRVLQHMVGCMVADVVGDDIPALLARACHEDPDQRFANMDDFRVALELVARNRGLAPSTRSCEKFTLEIFGHKVGHTDPRASRPQSVVPLRMSSEGQKTAGPVFHPDALETQIENDAPVASGVVPDDLLKTRVPGESDSDQVTSVGEAMPDASSRPRFVDEHLAVTVIGGADTAPSASSDPNAASDARVAAVASADSAPSGNEEVTAFSEVAPGKGPKEGGKGFPEEMIPTKPYEAHTLD